MENNIELALKIHGELSNLIRPVTPQSICASYADKVAAGGDSVLARLGPEEFNTGLNAIRTYALETEGVAVVEPIDLFIFCRDY